MNIKLKEGDLVQLRDGEVALIVVSVTEEECIPVYLNSLTTSTASIDVWEQDIEVGRDKLIGNIKEDLLAFNDYLKSQQDQHE